MFGQPEINYIMPECVNWVDTTLKLFLPVPVNRIRNYGVCWVAEQPRSASHQPDLAEYVQTAKNQLYNAGTCESGRYHTVALGAPKQISQTLINAEA